MNFVNPRPNYSSITNTGFKIAAGIAGSFRTLPMILLLQYILIGEIVICTKSIVFVKIKFSLLNRTFFPHRQGEVEYGLLNMHRERLDKKPCMP